MPNIKHKQFHLSFHKSRALCIVHCASAMVDGDPAKSSDDSGNDLENEIVRSDSHLRRLNYLYRTSWVDPTTQEGVRSVCSWLGHPGSEA